MKVLISNSALLPSQYRKFVKGWDKGRYADLFQKYNGDRNAYRIYLPLAKSNLIHVAVPKIIDDAVSSKGYIVDDYVNGIAVDKTGKRRIKIGKLLPAELQQMFANDKARQGARNQANGGMCVISRHPYDVAGMSTDRGWRSCMNLVGGSNKHYVFDDIREGSVVAYYVDGADKDSLNIKSPKARILLRVYEAENGKRGLYPSGVYGTGTTDFKYTVSKWCSEVNRDYFGIPIGMTMKLVSSLYDDGYARAVNEDPNPDSVSKLAAVALDERKSDTEYLAKFINTFGADITPVIEKMTNVSNLLFAIRNSNISPIDMSKAYSTLAKYLVSKSIDVKRLQSSTMSGFLISITNLNSPEFVLTPSECSLLAIQSPESYDYVASDLPNERVINSYELFGLDANQAAQILSQNTATAKFRTGWIGYTLKPELLAAYRSLVKVTKAELNEDPLDPKYIPLYDGVGIVKAINKAMKNAEWVTRQRRTDDIFNAVSDHVPPDAMIKMFKESDPAIWKNVWRGTNALACFGLRLSGSPLAALKPFSAIFAKEVSKYAKIDSDSRLARLFLGASIYNSKLITSSFMENLDPKQLTTPFILTIGYQVSQALNYAEDAEAIDELLRLNSKLAIVFYDHSRESDQDKVEIANHVLRELPFVITCLRNLKASKLPSAATGLSMILETLMDSSYLFESVMKNPEGLARLRALRPMLDV